MTVPLILKKWNSVTSSWEEAYPKTHVDQIIATGTPSSLTFLRGDGSWATLPTSLPASDVPSWAKGTYLSNRILSNADIADDVGVRVDYLAAGAISKPEGQDHALLTLAFSNAWAVQMAGDWRTKNMYLRTQESGTWKTWAKLLHTDNMSSIAITKSQITDFPTIPTTAAQVGALSASGGTVSGDITLSPAGTAQVDQKAIKWKSIASKTPYFGYALDQTDGTFVWSINGTNYASGLAIGGGSGNLLYKGGVVVTANNISSYAPTYGYATSSVAGLVKISVSGSTLNIITQ